MIAQEESKRLGHNFVGTEQLLLGLIGQRHGLASQALKKQGVNLRKTRKEVEHYIGRGTGFVSTEMPFTPRAKRVLEMAVYEAKDLGQNFVSTEHLLLALIGETDGVSARTLDKLGVDIKKLRKYIFFLMEENNEEMLGVGHVPEMSQTEKVLRDREKNGSPTPTLDEYADNLSTRGINGTLDPIVGRDEEIFDVVKVLARRRKNNPVLIGEPGVGKTAVAEGLAQLVIAENGPDFLDGSLVMALDIGSILAGTKYRGEFEERLKKILEEVQENPGIILVIDEIHTLVGAGAAEGAVDAANILKPALARGAFKCIGATTTDEYRKYIERDPALERRFQPIKVEEPSVEITIKILLGIRRKFEEHHALTYEEKAIEKAAILADKFIADRFLPDKAIDVLDEAGSRVRLANRRLPKGLKRLLRELQDTLNDKEESIEDQDFETTQLLIEHENEIRSHIRIMKESSQIQERFGIVRTELDIVSENDVAEVIAGWTGVPVTKVSDSESKQLLNMEDRLHERLIGQHNAIMSVSKAIRRARVGLRNPNKPIASFIFAGPTGVGKTELTKTLAEYMFGDQNTMLRFDMSEYMEKHTVAKLIGSPPGYVGYSEGGQLTEAVRGKPYAVVLLDEVEKAHPDVFNLLLQILDDGRLTDSQGKIVDFRNTLLIMTTNLGARVIEEESGIKFKAGEYTPKIKFGEYDWEPEREPELDNTILENVNNLVKEELKDFFRPEFLNRVDEIIVFSHLTRHDIWEISELMIKQLKKRLLEKELTLKISNPVRGLLIEEGYDPVYGARPLRRAVTRILEDRLAEECLVNPMHPGTIVYVDRVAEDPTLTDYSQNIPYTNKIKVTLDYSHVNPQLLGQEPKKLSKKSSKKLSKKSPKKLSKKSPKKLSKKNLTDSKEVIKKEVIKKEVIKNEAVKKEEVKKEEVKKKINLSGLFSNEKPNKPKKKNRFRYLGLINLRKLWRIIKKED